MSSNNTFYDPKLSYEENYNDGPFGEFANKKIYKNIEKPKNKFLGIPIFEPFGIPAGPLVNSKFVKAALDKGFDLVEYKTVRSRKHISHAWPNVLSVEINGNLTEKKAQKGLVGHFKFNDPPSITNSFGVPSMDPEIWQEDLAKSVRYAKSGQVVIGSFQATQASDHDNKKYMDDFVRSARLVKETGVEIMEVNLSCPNEGHSNMLCFDIERSKEVANLIKNEIGSIPLILKISYFHSNQRLGEFVHEIGSIVQGISAINTLPAKIFDEKGNQALPGEGRFSSGVCGDAIRWAGLEMVKRLYNLRQEFDYKFEIIGVGGVLNADHYKKYRKTGADAVMSATGAMWNPFLAQEIKKSL